MAQPADDTLRPVIGLIGGGVAVVIWAGWISATRFAMTESVDPLVLAVARCGLPALVLAPIIWRQGLVPPGASFWPIVVMSLGWGAPFVYMVGNGLQTVPASLFGPLVPGLAPILVACLAWAILGQRPGRDLVLGLILIGTAMAVILGEWVAHGELAALGGAPYLLAAAFGVSIFTVMARMSGLSPLEAAAYISFYSLPLLAVWAIWKPEVLLEPSLQEWGFHLLTQGLMTGIIAVLAYGLAVRHLGAVRGATANALVPVGAALVGVSVLGERLSLLDWGAIIAASMGVAVVNGFFRRSRRKTAP